MTSATVYKEKPKRKRGRRAVYRPPTFGRMLIVGLPLFFFLLTVGLYALGEYWVGAGNPRAAEIALAIGYFPCLLFFIYLFAPLYVCRWWLFARLIIAPEGIEYHVLEHCGFADWHNMANFGYRHTPEGPAWGIVLNRQVDAEPNQLPIFPRHYDPGAGCLNTFIPLSLIILNNIPGTSFQMVDVEDFRLTPLGQDLLYYAPHLFEGVKAKGKWS